MLIMQHQSVPWAVMAEGSTRTLLLPLHMIPATMNGLLRHNETNALFAAAMAWAHGIDFATIRSALSSFANPTEQNPGRYNMIEGFPFQVLLDYGHNPDGVREICDIATKMKVSGKRRLLSRNVSNRHKAHLVEVAPLLAKTFDSFIFSCVPKSVLKCKEYAGEDPIGNMLAACDATMRGEGVLAEHLIIERDDEEAIARRLAQPALAISWSYWQIRGRQW